VKAGGEAKPQADGNAKPAGGIAATTVDKDNKISESVAGEKKESTSVDTKPSEESAKAVIKPR